MGSDYDGYFAPLPKDIKAPGGYSALRAAMLRRYTEQQSAKFMSMNAERVLKSGWGN
jgi:microsomal dipeptidase-like Zn-dependent dipeptidase